MLALKAPRACITNNYANAQYLHRIQSLMCLYVTAISFTHCVMVWIDCDSISLNMTPMPGLSVSAVCFGRCLLPSSFGLEKNPVKDWKSRGKVDVSKELNHYYHHIDNEHKHKY